MITLGRHRIVTLFTNDKNWTVWYTADPRTAAGAGAEIETKTFSKASLKRVGSSKRLGHLYREILNGAN